jgi:hypothetical protein
VLEAVTAEVNVDTLEFRELTATDKLAVELDNVPRLAETPATILLT